MWSALVSEEFYRPDIEGLGISHYRHRRPDSIKKT